MAWAELSLRHTQLQAMAELLESRECVAARTLTKARSRALEGTDPPIFGRAAALCSCWLAALAVPAALSALWLC